MTGNLRGGVTAVAVAISVLSGPCLHAIASEIPVTDSNANHGQFTDVLERARAGVPEAQFAIAALLEHNCIDQTSVGAPSAFTWYALAAENGHVASALKVAKHDLLSGEQDASPSRGIELLQKMVKKGEPYSKWLLARELDRGVFVNRDASMAKRLLIEADEAGISDAAFYLAAIHAKAGDSQEALRWYERAADLGNVAAMRILARIYLYGKFAGVETEVDKQRYQVLMSAAENATIERDREREEYDPCVF